MDEKPANEQPLPTVGYKKFKCLTVHLLAAREAREAEEKAQADAQRVNEAKDG